MLTAPLRELLKKGIHFQWEERHQQALDVIKKELCKATALWYYDPSPTTTTILQCDASIQGLGAWLRQVDREGNERIVAMCSRSLTASETRYSNIERECLGVQYGLEKFEYYLMGRHTLLGTDHAPPADIQKNIAEAPARLQRMLLRCLKFDVEIVYKPGPTIPVADALSRVCVPTQANPNKSHQQNSTSTTKENTDQHEVRFVEGVEHPVDLQRIKEAASRDVTYNMLKNTVYRGWPDQRKDCQEELFEFWNFRCDLVLDDGLVLKGNRIVIPEALRRDVLTSLHTGHQGETKTVLLAKESVFWPGVTNEIKKMIQSCATCVKYQHAQPSMPIMQPELPTRPMQKLGTDIFDYKGGKYLIVVDYYSRFPIIRKLENITASTVSTKFTSIILEHGMPTEIIADFGTQYTSAEFRKRCKDCGIKLTFSAPHHHQANSVAERSVGTIKQLWKKADESGQCRGTAVLMYRSTPLDGTMPSPYELLFNRKPNTFLPTAEKALNPTHPNYEDHLLQNQRRQQDQAKSYDRRHGANLRELYPSEPVSVYNTINRMWEPGYVVQQTQPRTYIVDKSGRELYRTREHIKPRSALMPKVTNENVGSSSNRVATGKAPTPQRQSVLSTPTPNADVAPPTKEASPMRTRSGRVVSVPARYIDYVLMN